VGISVHTQAIAACKPSQQGRILTIMGTKSRESIYGSSIRASAERAAAARKEADKLACEAWNLRMLG
jgi:hypothetical protein